MNVIFNFINLYTLAVISLFMVLIQWIHEISDGIFIMVILWAIPPTFNSPVVYFGIQLICPNIL